MNVRYCVDLSQAEHDDLTAMMSGGKHAARKLKRAQILLAAHAGIADETIAASLAVSGSTVYRTKRRFVEGNLELALSEEPRPGAMRKLSGKEEALLVATACSSPPPGRARWTLALLADAFVQLTEHDSLSRETVRRRLAENDLKPWRKDMWCIPKIDGEYVARMEDVLDLYAEAPDPNRPVVCFDESPTQLIGEMRAPIPAKRGQLRAADQGGDGQPLHPFGRSALRRLPRTGSSTDPQEAGVPPHAQTRQLAQHGRDRDRRPARPMSGPPHRRQTPSGLRDRRVGKTAQRRQSRNQLDVHHPERTPKTPPRLPRQRVIISAPSY